MWIHEYCFILFYVKRSSGELFYSNENKGFTDLTEKLQNKQTKEEKGKTRQKGN